jgi:outer membrane receptor protein involved in Fe transport
MKAAASLLLLLFLVNIGFAQTGKISGQVVSAKTGVTLSGVSISVSNSAKPVTSDVNGNFTISNLPAGTYTLTCSYVSYETKAVEGVIVKAGDVTSQVISLDEKTQKGEVATVKVVKASRESISSLLSIQKNMASVSDGISAESIKKTPDRTTGDVIRRISGAAIQDDRFAIIRGLNDRYNAAFINGAPLPSTETDRKAFAFDIFPSSVLDNLVIYKTATPDMSSEFAGGLINITTKSIPAKDFQQYSFGLGHNSLATFQEKIKGSPGRYDFMGLEDGDRRIPEGMPTSQQFLGLSQVRKAEAAKLFGNYKWGLEADKAGPNFNFQYSKGMNVERKGKEFMGILFSLTYNNSKSYNEGERNSFDYDASGSAVAPIWKGRFVDRNYATETLLGFLANVSAKLSPRSTIFLKNIYSVTSDNRIVKRNGSPDYEADSLFKQNTNARWFTSSQIFSSQLGGDHVLTAKKLKLSWMTSFGTVVREIPNLSQFIAVGYEPDLQPLFSNGSSVGQTNGINMFFSKNNEKIYNVKMDIAQPFKFMKRRDNFVKAGFYYQKRVRDFKARIFGFQPYNAPGQGFDFNLLKLREDSIFLPQHLGRMANGKGGFMVVDGNLPTFNYDAQSELKAGYLMADQRFFNFIRLIYGVRIENFNQKLNSLKDYNKPTNVNTTIQDVLPSGNLVVSVTPKMNLRLSYAQTINRPEFRELAPFLFYDFVSQYTIEGFDTLQRSKITNYDFRYEFYPGKAQLFSVSAFYKTFTNPIEVVSNPDFDNLATYSNAKTAKVYGVEAEFRTLLGSLTGAGEKSFLNDITLSANAAFTRSEVKLGSFGLYDLSKLVQNRALQGQSPYIINGSIGYANQAIGFTTTISYNRVGPRIFIAGTLSDADIYEQTRDVVDVQLSKSFLKEKQLEVKINLRDLLAQKQLFYFDFNKSKKYEAEADRAFSSQVMPKVISLNISYKF